MLIICLKHQRALQVKCHERQKVLTIFKPIVLLQFSPFPFLLSLLQLLRFLLGSLGIPVYLVSRWAPSPPRPVRGSLRRGSLLPGRHLSQWELISKILNYICLSKALYKFLPLSVDLSSPLLLDCHPSCRSCVGPLASDCLRCLKPEEALLLQSSHLQHGVCTAGCPAHSSLDYKQTCRGEYVGFLL